MKLTGRVKPISWLKAHAPQVIRDLAEDRQPVVITLHGEARAVIQDIASYEQTQETLGLLKMLSLTNKSVEAGNVAPASVAFAGIRERVSK